MSRDAPAGKLTRKALEETSLTSLRGKEALEVARLRIMQRLAFGQKPEDIARDWKVSHVAVRNYVPGSETTEKIRGVVKHAQRSIAKRGKVSAKDLVDSVDDLLSTAGAKTLIGSEKKIRHAEMVLKLRWRLGLPINEGTMQSNTALNNLRNRLAKRHGTYPAAIRNVLGVDYAQVRKQEKGQGLGNKFGTVAERDSAIIDAHATGKYSRKDLAKLFGLKIPNVTRIIKKK